MQIELHYLPGYCPHFNKIERVWWLYHKEVTRNKVHETYGDFEEDTLKFMDNFDRNWLSGNPSTAL